MTLQRPSQFRKRQRPFRPGLIHGMPLSVLANVQTKYA